MGQVGFGRCGGPFGQRSADVDLQTTCLDAYNNGLGTARPDYPGVGEPAEK